MTTHKTSLLALAVLLIALPSLAEDTHTGPRVHLVPANAVADVVEKVGDTERTLCHAPCGVRTSQGALVRLETELAAHNFVLPPHGVDDFTLSIRPPDAARQRVGLGLVLGGLAGTAVLGGTSLALTRPFALDAKPDSAAGKVLGIGAVVSLAAALTGGVLMLTNQGAVEVSPGAPQK